MVLPVELGHRLAVEQFAQQVAIPPDTEVHGEIALPQLQVLLMLRVGGVLCAIDHLSVDITDAMTVGAPHLHTGVGGVDISGHAAAHVTLRRHLKQHLASAGIAEVATIAAVLMAVPHLQLGRRRVEAHQMDGIAMAHAGVVEAATVVIHSHRAVGYLIAAIAIHIGHTQVVIALCGIAGPLGLVGVEGPALAQFASVPIPGCQHGAGVVAATEDGRRLASVEIAHSRQHAVGAVGIVVAPVGQVATLGHVGFGVHGATGQSVEHGDILIARQDATCHGAPALVILAPLAFGLGVLGIGRRTVAVVGLGIANHAPCPIAGAVAGAHNQFSAPVAIQIIKDEGHVVGTAADIDTHINAPQAFAVQAVAVEDGGSGKTVVGIVVRIRGVPLQEYLILSVAIHIGHTGIVGMIGVGLAIGGGATGRALQFDGQIAVGGIGLHHKFSVAPATAHLVGGFASQGVLIHKERTATGQGLGIEFLAIAIHIKGLVGSIAGQHAPAHHHMTAMAKRHGAAVQLLHVHLTHIIARLSLHKRWGNEM